MDSVFDYSGGPNVITRVHTRGKKKRAGVSKSEGRGV